MLSTPILLSCSGPNSASVSATACIMPPPSRITRKLTPPRRRSECSQPATRTRSPMCLPTSTVCIRCIKKVPFIQQKALILFIGGRGLYILIRLSWYHHHLPRAGGLSRFVPYFL